MELCDNFWAVVGIPVFCGIISLRLIILIILCSENDDFL